MNYDEIVYLVLHCRKGADINTFKIIYTLNKSATAKEKYKLF